jgi:hypothetical protein
VKVKETPIGDVKPYAKNPRVNDHAVQAVMESIAAFGFQQPIVVDKDMTVIVGHTRLKAALALGMTTVPVHIATGLTPTQVKAYRIADNRTGELADWDLDALKIELDELKLEEFDLGAMGFNDAELEEMLADKPETKAGSKNLDSEKYTAKIKSPIYEPSGDKPELPDLIDKSKYNELIKAIDSSGIDKQLADFLRIAASRHIEFNYGKIANYYAHSNDDIRDFFIKSALVIIDYERAIELGFVHLNESLNGIYDEN